MSSQQMIFEIAMLAHVEVSKSSVCVKILKISYFVKLIQLWSYQGITWLREYFV